jgi:PKD repeat protein
LVPGNYTFGLTVTDSDGDSNSTLANVEVIKETDYPPEANAGEPVVIYLPQNQITLNGNQSTDDHGITSWEWILMNDGSKLGTSEAVKAVDMQVF